ncbi:putative LRR receptor-like serine/threonine-protein kinase [Rosa sericea]
MVLSSLFFCFRGKKKNRRTEWNYSDFLRVSYNTLSEATDSFSSANLVGVGSFGSVYKVVLVMPSDKAQLVAVKVFNMLRWGASNSFIAECEMFRNIRHRNIVKIVTTCSSVDFRGNDFKALVYEFMENGSLEEWLHPTFRAQNPPKNLNLLERLDIAIDVACALDYLHNHCETPIVHCDLKLSNVLLDNELTGRVSDFGLARFLLKTNNVAANQSSSRGSVGYVAPEYKRGSEASTDGDVYSFGILLLEMFTGKRPSDQMFRDDLNLHTFVKMAFFERVIEIADSRLFLQEDYHNTPTKYCVRFSSEIQECLSRIFGIGIVCSSKSPRDRMEMGNVLTELQSIRNILNACTQLHGLSTQNERTNCKNGLKFLRCPMQNHSLPSLSNFD